jgi:hypothetical protein
MLDEEYKLLIMQFSQTSYHFIPLSVQIFSPAPCTQTPSFYVPPLMAETKFHIHTEQIGRLKFKQNQSRLLSIKLEFRVLATREHIDIPLKMPPAVSCWEMVSIN